MGALAECERDLICERTNVGLAAARARGCVGGRLRKLSTDGKVALALRLVEDHNHSVDDLCSTLGISRSTFYRYVRKAKKHREPLIRLQHCKVSLVFCSNPRTVYVYAERYTNNGSKAL